MSTIAQQDSTATTATPPGAPSAADTKDQSAEAPQAQDILAEVPGAVGTEHKAQLRRRIEVRLGELADSRAQLGDNATPQADAIEAAIQTAQEAMSGGWERVGEMEAVQLSKWLESTECYLKRPAQNGAAQSPAQNGAAQSPAQNANQTGGQTMQQSGGSVNVEATTCAKLDGDKPVQPTTEFSKDAEAIYIAWKSEDVQQGMAYRVVWIADDVGQAAAPKTTIAEKTGVASDKQIGEQATWWSGNLSLTRPTNGWPVGSYHADLYFGDKLVKSLPFTIR